MIWEGFGKLINVVLLHLRKHQLGKSETRYFSISDHCVRQNFSLTFVISVNS